jgi:hypothetical protein
MIGMNWKKSLIVVGAVLGVAATVPALTQAHTQDVLPPTIAMTETPVVVTPVKKVSTKKIGHHKSIKKLAKHKVSRKHKKLSAKKRTA